MTSEAPVVVPRRHLNVGLTARLALVALGSATIPFLVGAILLVALPDSVRESGARADAARATRAAAAELQLQRTSLQLALERVPVAELRVDEHAAGAQDRLDALAKRLAHDAGFDSRSARNVEVDVRGPGEQPGIDDGAIAASISIETVTAGRAAGAQPSSHERVVVVRAPRVESRLLEELGRDFGVRLAVVPHTQRTDKGTPLAATPVDARRDLGVEARPARAGGRLGSGLSDQLTVGLILLLTAGLLAGTATALVVNRELMRVAAVARRIAGGDHATRLPVVGRDAGAIVARSLNDLAHEVEERIAALRATVERLDRIIAATGDGICTWSSDGEVETWSAEAVRLTGLEVTGLAPGVAAYELLAEERDPGRRRVLLPVQPGGRSLAVDLEVRRMRDGGTLQVFRDASPTLSIDQARKNFLITAAHELRTPLTSVLGFAATLADQELELDDDVRRIATEQLLIDARRMEQAVGTLFEGSLLARDKVEVAIEPIAVDRCIEDVLAGMGLAGTIALDASDALVVAADGTALRRVLTEGIDNARKYGGAPISIEARRVQRGIRIDIIDQGAAGVDVMLVEAIFEPFYRIDPEMRSAVGGAGMGLWVSRRLTEAMGGSIAILRMEADGPVPARTVLRIVLPSGDSVRLRGDSGGAEAGSRPAAIDRCRAAAGSSEDYGLRG